MSDIIELLNIKQENSLKCFDCKKEWNEERKPFGTIAFNYRDIISRTPRNLCEICYNVRLEKHLSLLNKDSKRPVETRSNLILKVLKEKES